MSKIQYIVDKLYQIDTELGGNAENKSKQTKDQFVILKDRMLILLNEIRNKLKIKNDPNRSGDTIRAGIEFTQKMNEAEQLLNSMNTELRKQQKEGKDKKALQKDFEMKQKLYENLRSQLKDISLLDDNSFNQDSSRIETFTDQKAKLMGQNKKIGLNEPLQQTNREPTQEENEAMQRWRAQSIEQDKKLEVIINGVKEWNKAAVLMGEKIDESAEKIKGLDKEVSTTNRTLEGTNKRLKVIVDKYRAPSKFCMDVFLILLIIGLGVTLYYYFK